MRNLLYQFRRLMKHTKSILMKLINKMTHGTKETVKTIIASIAVCIVMPLALLFWGTVGITLLLFKVLGGEPIKNVEKLLESTCVN